MARDFDGSTDRIDYASFFDAPESAKTMAAWLYLDALAHTSYFISLAPSGDGGLGTFVYVTSAGAVSHYITYSGNPVYREGTNGLVSTGAWTHVLVTHDGGIFGTTGIDLYVDGSIDTGTTNNSNGSGDPTPTTGTASIGARIYDDARNVDGRIARKSGCPCADIQLGRIRHRSIHHRFRYRYVGPRLVAHSVLCYMFTRSAAPISAALIGVSSPRYNDAIPLHSCAAPDVRPLMRMYRLRPRRSMPK